jgi:hypothetical protein
MDEAEAGPQGQICSSATILDTPTRNAPKYLIFPLPLLHHLQLVHVYVVPVSTTKECSDHTCLCYRVVIIELLMQMYRLVIFEQFYLARSCNCAARAIANVVTVYLNSSLSINGSTFYQSFNDSN